MGPFSPSNRVLAAKTLQVGLGAETGGYRPKKKSIYSRDFRPLRGLCGDGVRCDRLGAGERAPEFIILLACARRLPRAIIQRRDGDVGGNEHALVTHAAGNLDRCCIPGAEIDEIERVFNAKRIALFGRDGDAPSDAARFYLRATEA